MSVNILDLDEIVEEVIEKWRLAEYRKRMILSKCQHCHRRLRIFPETVGLCSRCRELPGHTPEERLLAAIFGKEIDCGKCYPDSCLRSITNS